MIKLPSIRAPLAPSLVLLLLTALPFAPARAADDFLDPDQAFQLSVRVLDAKRLELSYKVAPGYYLYRERFKFASPDAKLGEPQIPPGKKHYDTALEQNVETYHDGVVVVLPVAVGRQGLHAERDAPGLRRQGPVLPAAAAHRGRHAEGLRRRRRLREGRGRRRCRRAPPASSPPVAVPAQGGMSVATRRAARSAAQRHAGRGVAGDRRSTVPATTGRRPRRRRRCRNAGAAAPTQRRRQPPRLRAARRPPAR